MMDRMWWIALVLVAVGLFGAFVLAASRRKGPDIEGAFVDTELEAEQEARDLTSRNPD